MIKLTIFGVDILEADTIEQATTAAAAIAVERLALPDDEGFFNIRPELSTVKARATEWVNEETQKEVTRRGILTDKLFFAANVADIGFLVTEWRNAGKPVDLDPIIYYRAYTEARAYAAISDPTMTPYKMICVWEGQWNWMRRQFADLNEVRRLALERIKLATGESQVVEALAALLWP